MAFSLLGGAVSGSSQSDATQSAQVSFTPTIEGGATSPIVSPYAAGQGLQTVNIALPASAAVQSTTSSSLLSDVTSDPTALLLLVGFGLAAWFLMKRR
jgi:hypothetical protein